ncbi:MAG: hypothetical protein KatS3mg035_1625 [Bacteroidia bacterium]|nr:MAG: hypothetical protein KatS3mg035_1625 [Bacteroidia bacterium]
MFSLIHQQDYITIQNNFKTNYHVSIIDNRGKTCLSIYVTENEKRIDISKLSIGNYFIKIDGEEQQLILPLIKKIDCLFIFPLKP